MYDFFVDVLRVFDNHLKAILISLRKEPPYKIIIIRKQ